MTKTITKTQVVAEIVQVIEAKLDLLYEWTDKIAQSIVLSKVGKMDESNILDNRCQEIESQFEDEYGIEFDSYGDVVEDETTPVIVYGRTIKHTTVGNLIDYNEKKLPLLKEWQQSAEAYQELADGACLDATDGYGERCKEIEEEYEEEYGVKL